MGLLLFYLFLALTISFLCSVLEAVLLSTPASFIEVKEKEGKKAATVFKKLKQEIDRPLSAILSLNTVAHTVGAAGVGAQSSLVFGDIYFGLTSAVLTLLILVLSEIIPKTIGARYWRSIALPSVNVITIMIYICFPLVWISERITKLFARKGLEQSVSREEVSAMVNVGEQEGVFKNDESSAIQNMIRLKEKKTRDIMTPRIVCVVVDEEMSLSTFFTRKEFFKHSRIPLYTDTKDNITGYVLLQKIFEHLVDDHKDMKLKDLKREIVVASEQQSVSILWEKMIEEKEQISIVVDEYGSFEGIVTTEDIVESMLGLEIVDERDTVTDMQEYARMRWELRKKMLGG